MPPSSPTFRGPPARPLIGHGAEMRADRLGFLARCAREYGDVVPLRLPGGRRILLFSRPDLIEQVLVAQAGHFVKHFGLRMYRPALGDGLLTSEGEFWRRQRRLSAPAFHPSRLAGYAAEMAAATERMLDGWEAEAKAVAGESRRRRDVHADLMRLTLEIACRTLFGADACPDPHAVGRAMERALRAIDVRFGRIVPLPDWLPVPSNLRLRRAMRTIDGVVNGIIAHGRSAEAGAGDALLSVLLRARDDDDDEAGDAGRAAGGMTDAQLLDEARTVLLAGHETTALTLGYALYLLAAHPAAQAELHAELDAVLATGRAPAYADLPRLACARRVVLESMRLYPPADVLGREAITDCDVLGVAVPRGATVFMSQWVMHRDERWFADPLRFDPGRWTEAFERSLPRFAYFPFGGGPRVCVGQAFAMAEATLVLAALCRRFAFAPDPSFELALWPSITLRPRDGIRLLVQPRSSSLLNPR